MEGGGLKAGFTLTQLAQVLDEFVNFFIRQGIAPGGHQYGFVDSLSTFLDGFEQLVVGSRRHLIGIGVVTRFRRHVTDVDSLSIPLAAVALDAISLVIVFRPRSGRH